MERNIAHIALFAAMIAALGLVPQITLGFGVPITAQSLGVMLAGAVLGARKGAAATILLLLLVALGLPLLSGGRGGLGVFVSPTGGFALGFIAAAFVTGLIVERVPLRPAGLIAAIAAAVGGIVTLYIPGVIVLAQVLNKALPEALALVTVFIPGDMIKAVIVGLLVQGLAKVRPQILQWYRQAPSNDTKRL